MKISILTPTYNRKKELERLYESIDKNEKKDIEIEWLIMDDGSQDGTNKLVEQWINNSNFSIQYFYQENQGKMVAINELVQKTTGELIIECDSDDYFVRDAFLKVKNAYEEHKAKEDIYGICFLKQDQNGNNMGKNFTREQTTMFDLYFKLGEDGEKAIVFKGEVRKKYKHELEKEENFVTEARMYHKMDLYYHMICINETIMTCEYKEDGYTKNIQEQFIKNPYGYYEYFKEMFFLDFNGIMFAKRMYIIKHYILFSVLTQKGMNLRQVKGVLNKLLVILLYLPGKLMTKRKFTKKK